MSSGSYLPLLKGSPQDITPLNFQIAEAGIHLTADRQEAGGTQQLDMNEVLLGRLSWRDFCRVHTE